MKEWKYLIGSADDFIGAPEWATKLISGERSGRKSFVGCDDGITVVASIDHPEDAGEMNLGYVHNVIAQRTESFGNAIDLEFCKANPDHPDCKCKDVDIAQLITERGNKYGAFKDGAEIMRDLKNAMHSTDGWEKLSPSQQEALDMIQHKIGRVLNGDPNYDDNWKDIAGYATLIAEELSGNIK